MTESSGKRFGQDLRLGKRYYLSTGHLAEIIWQEVCNTSPLVAIDVMHRKLPHFTWPLSPSWCIFLWINYSDQTASLANTFLIYSSSLCRRTSSIHVKFTSFPVMVYATLLTFIIYTYYSFFFKTGNLGFICRPKPLTLQGKMGLKNVGLHV